MINLSSFIRYHADAHAAAAGNRLQGPAASVLPDCYQRIEKAAGYLAARGIGPDDVVAVMMKNSTAFLELAFAVESSRRRVPADQFSSGCRRSRIHCRQCGGEAPVRGCRIRRRGQKYSFDNPLGRAGADRHARPLPPTHAPAPMHQRGPDELFRLMYTSGTTDRPKGVMHTYANFYWKCMDHVIALGLDGDERLLVHRPAVPCRRIRSARHGRAVGRRHALCPSRFRCRARARLDRGRETHMRLACAGHARLGAGASRPRIVRCLDHSLGDRRRRAHAGIAHPRLLRVFHQGPLHRRLWAHRSPAAATR